MQCVCNKKNSKCNLYYSFLTQGDSLNQKDPKKAKYAEHKKHANFSARTGGSFNNTQNKGVPFEKPNWNAMKKETKEKQMKRLKRKVGGDELYDSFKKVLHF